MPQKDNVQRALADATRHHSKTQPNVNQDGHDGQVKPRDATVTRAKPLHPGKVRPSPADLHDKSISVQVQVPVKSKLGKKASKEQPTQVDTQSNPFDDLPSETYFATFDATAMSTAWAQVVSHQKQLHQSLVDEVAVKGKPQSTQASTTIRTTSSSPITTTTQLSDGLESGDTIQSNQSSHPPKLTKQEEIEMTAAATKAISESNTFKRIDPTNTIQLLRNQLPLVMYLACDCPFDEQFAKALINIESVIKKRNWKNRFSFAYAPLPMQNLIHLGDIYQVDETIIDIGMCAPKRCPGNKRVVNYRFMTPFPENQPPNELTVKLHNECCGDQFNLAVSDVAHTGFTVEVVRTGVPELEGWRQPLQLTWETPARYKLPNGVPALVIDNIPLGVHMEKYKFTSSLAAWQTTPADIERYTQEIIKFMENFLLGQLPLIVRSKPQPVPVGFNIARASHAELTAMAHTMRDKEASQGHMVEIVGDTFRELVLDEQRDVLLFIYSPMCAASRSLAPMFEQVAEALRDASQHNVFVAKFDKTANDLPVTGIKVTHLPTVLYFPAGNFDSPLYTFFDYEDYNGSRAPHDPRRPHSHFTREMILKFMLDHGQRKADWPTKLSAEIDAAKPALYIHDHAHADHHHNH